MLDVSRPSLPEAPVVEVIGSEKAVGRPWAQMGVTLAETNWEKTSLYMFWSCCNTGGEITLGSVRGLNQGCSV